MEDPVRDNHLDFQQNERHRMHRGSASYNLSQSPLRREARRRSTLNNALLFNRLLARMTMINISEERVTRVGINDENDKELEHNPER